MHEPPTKNGVVGGHGISYGPAVYIGPIEELAATGLLAFGKNV
jgi:hypothetical protein